MEKLPNTSPSTLLVSWVLPAKGPHEWAGFVADVKIPTEETVLWHKADACDLGASWATYLKMTI